MEYFTKDFLPHAFSHPQILLWEMQYCCWYYFPHFMYNKVRSRGVKWLIHRHTNRKYQELDSNWAIGLQIPSHFHPQSCSPYQLLSGCIKNKRTNTVSYAENLVIPRETGPEKCLSGAAVWVSCHSVALSTALVISRRGNLLSWSQNPLNTISTKGGGEHASCSKGPS